MLQARARIAAKVIARSGEGVGLKDIKVPAPGQRPLVDAVRVNVISCDENTWVALEILLVTRRRTRLARWGVFALLQAFSLPGCARPSIPCSSQKTPESSSTALHFFSRHPRSHAFFSPAGDGGASFAGHMTSLGGGAVQHRV